MCGPFAESVLGTARFAHLYLTSALMSQLVVCLWRKHLKRKAGGPGGASLGLGASGAISGVMAWWSFELTKRGQVLVIGDRKVSPLLFWALYVAIDATGLLRLGAVQKVLTGFLQQLIAMNGGKEIRMKRRASLRGLAAKSGTMPTSVVRSRACSGKLPRCSGARAGK